MAQLSASNTDSNSRSDRAVTGNQPDNSTPTGSGAASTLTGTIALAKLTTGGTNGSIGVTNGLITAYTAPT